MPSNKNRFVITYFNDLFLTNHNPGMSRVFSFFIGIGIGMLSAAAQETAVPFRVAPLFDLDKPNTLGLDEAPGAETFTLFAPETTQNTYNHGVVLFPFKDKLYAQWQSSSKDEDGPDTQVMYSSSSDGQHWDTPKPLTSIGEHGIKTSGGWYRSHISMYGRMLKKIPSKAIPFTEVLQTVYSGQKNDR